MSQVILVKLGLKMGLGCPEIEPGDVVEKIAVFGVGPIQHSSDDTFMGQDVVEAVISMHQVTFFGTVRESFNHLVVEGLKIIPLKKGGLEEVMPFAKKLVFWIFLTNINEVVSPGGESSYSLSVKMSEPGSITDINLVNSSQGFYKGRYEPFKFFKGQLIQRLARKFGRDGIGEGLEMAQMLDGGHWNMRGGEMAKDVSLFGKGFGQGATVEADDVVMTGYGKGKGSGNIAIFN